MAATSNAARSGVSPGARTETVQSSETRNMKTMKRNAHATFLRGILTAAERMYRISRQRQTPPRHARHASSRYPEIDLLGVGICLDVGTAQRVRRRILRIYL